MDIYPKDEADKARKELLKMLPELCNSEFSITSPYDKRYNCIAWAAGDNSRWWKPDSLGNYYWPSDIEREYTIEAFEQLYFYLGYTKVDGESINSHNDVVALFTKDGKPTHAARKIGIDIWTSKIGRCEDISHSLKSVEGSLYGDATYFFVK